MAYSAFASFSAAAVASAILHPFDVAKSRLHVCSISSAVPEFHGSRETFRCIFRVEGVRGLYRGLFAAMVASGVSWGVFRWTFDKSRDIIRSNTECSTINASFSENLGASLIAGIATSLLVHPLWMVKTRLELQTFESKQAGWTQYKGVVDCLKKIVQKEGFEAIYKGLGPALCLVPHAALHLLLYEELKKQNFSLSWVPIIGNSVGPFVLGGASKFVAVCCFYPLQVLRSRQQVLHSPYDGQNFLHIGWNMSQKEGLKSLYNGFLVNMQRACLHSAIMFFLFETFRSNQI